MQVKTFRLVDGIRSEEFEYSIWHACNASNMMGNLCNPWGPLSDICSTYNGESMKTMIGCSTYNSICNGSASQPSQCLSYISIKLPTTNAVQTACAAICAATTATACSSCGSSSSSSSSMAGMNMRSHGTRRAQCSYTLDLLSTLCKQYPTNSQCSGWSAWCGANANASVATFCAVPITGSTKTSSAYRAGLSAASLAMSVLGIFTVSFS